MATLDTPTIGQLLTVKLGQYLARRQDAKAFKLTQAERARMRPILFIRLMLHLGGFGCLTYAGFEWSTIAGYAVAGISCFVLSTLVTSNSRPQTPPPADPMANRR